MNKKLWIRLGFAIVILAVVITLGFVLRSIFGEARRLKTQSISFSDVPADYWAYSEIMAVANKGIVTGYPDGTFKPEVVITRDQLSVFIARTIAGGDSNVPTGPSKASFPDVPTSHWAYKYIEYTKNRGIIDGYPDGRFYPGYEVTRDQMAVFIARALNTTSSSSTTQEIDALIPAGPTVPTFTDVGTSYWAYKFIEYIYSKRIATGYKDGYHPLEKVTRAQMAVFVSRAYELQTPVPGTSLFYDDFSGNFSKWTEVYNGMNPNGIKIEDGVLKMTPKTATTSSATHAPLVVTRTGSKWTNYVFSAKMKTVRQLRTGSPPNPWEVGWLTFRMQEDDNKFYYFIHKENGFELGKAYPKEGDRQEFLATIPINDQSFSGFKLQLNTWYNYTIILKNTNIKILVDGVEVINHTDNTPDPWYGGKIGLYNEDAEVHYDNVTVIQN